METVTMIVTMLGDTLFLINSNTNIVCHHNTLVAMYVCMYREGKSGDRLVNIALLLKKECHQWVGTKVVTIFEKDFLPMLMPFGKYMLRG